MVRPGKVEGAAFVRSCEHISIDNGQTHVRGTQRRHLSAFVHDDSGVWVSLAL